MLHFKENSNKKASIFRKRLNGKQWNIPGLSGAARRLCLSSLHYLPPGSTFLYTNAGARPSTKITLSHMQTIIQNEHGIRPVTIHPSDNPTPEVDRALYQVIEQPSGSLQELLIAWNEQIKQESRPQSDRPSHKTT
jgi:hypothetical protein